MQTHPLPQIHRNSHLKFSIRPLRLGLRANSKPALHCEKQKTKNPKTLRSKCPKNPVQFFKIYHETERSKPKNKRKRKLNWDSYGRRAKDMKMGSLFLVKGKSKSRRKKKPTPKTGFAKSRGLRLGILILKA